MKALILYSSFTGTCRYYANCYKTALEQSGFTVDKLNASTPETRATCLKKIAPAHEYDVVGFGSSIAMGGFQNGFKDFVERDLSDDYLRGKRVFTFCTANATCEGAGVVGTNLVKRGGQFFYHGFWPSTLNWPPLAGQKGLLLSKADLDIPRRHGEELVQRLEQGVVTSPPSVPASFKVMSHLGVSAKMLGKLGLGRVTVDPTRCIGCGKCVRTCPTGAMRMGPTHVAEKGAGCHGCFACFNACPSQAITKRFADPDKCPQFQFNDTYIKMVQTADLPEKKRLSKTEWDALKARVKAKK
ncbi:4Fe-4S Ferredoxin [Carpediemonas membranifera]|uniref:4Fe-4S Ferredoxin n=1 Tax=Carpediemonas membranifera TaxID=201153 RepID=A0A8J6AX88_9EUKA|nr:4Fe-4S Ferredoxin [Carpediemonas membranifera]|eukprot:KAG9389539.1 4Fe-4S Ferredoxin [Carpediemonas membranifera]